MNRSYFTALLASLILFASPASAATAADETFGRLADDYLEGLALLSPVHATAIGDHRADGELDEVDAAARDRARSTYLDYRRRLAEIDRAELSRANQVDAAMLSNAVESALFHLDTFEQWAWNPLYYVNLSGQGIYGLLAREFAPLEDRLESVAARLEQLPRFLAQTRQALQPERVPKIHAETAVKQNPGLLSIIDAMIVPQLADLPVALRERLETAIETARDAIAEHQTWLEEELLPRAAGDFRIGAELYDRKLSYALHSPLTRKEIKALAETEYELVRNEMYELAKQVYTQVHPHTVFPDNPDEAYKQAIIRAALEQAYRELPPRDGIVDIAREYLQQATDFVIEKNIVTMPEEPVEIIIMPEFQRGVTLAYLDPPGPLDRDQKAFLRRCSFAAGLDPGTG